MLSHEERIPEQITDEWMAAFNAQFDIDRLPGCIGSIETEEWLEQPAGVPVSSREFVSNDLMNGASWRQKLSGTVIEIARTNLPGGAIVPVLALWEAQVNLPDDQSIPLADGRTVLVRLDRLAGQTISLSF